MALNISVQSDGDIIIFSRNISLCKNRDDQTFKLYFDNIGDWVNNQHETYIQFNGIDVKIDINTLDDDKAFNGIIPDGQFNDTKMTVYVFYKQDDTLVCQTFETIDILGNKIKRDINIDYQDLYNKLFNQYNSLNQKYIQQVKVIDILTKQNKDLKLKLRYNEIKIDKLIKIIGDLQKQINKQFVKLFKHNRNGGC